jgi:hypothetical protein
MAYSAKAENRQSPTPFTIVFGFWPVSPLARNN